MRLTAFVVLMYAALFSSEAYGCKCAPPAPGPPRCGLEADNLEAMAPHLFVGRVTSVTPKDYQQYFAMLAARLGPGFWEMVGAQGSEEEERKWKETEFLARKEILLEIWGQHMTLDQRKHIEQAETDEDLSGLGRYISRRIDLQVLESFGGPFEGTVAIRTGMGLGDCGLSLSEGETYLVSAGRDEEGFWSSSVCSKTAPASSAVETIKALRAWSTERKTLSRRVFGRAVDTTTLLVDPEHGRSRGIASLPVVLLGADQPIETVTDGDGNFVFEDLEPGTYEVVAELPGWSQDRETLTIADLTQQNCAQINLNFQRKLGEIRGRLSPQPGHAIPEYLHVYAIPADPGNREQMQSARLYEGTFSLELPDPGDYFVAVAIAGEDEDGQPSVSLPRDRDWPHPTLYYPGVPETVEAAVLHVEGGTVIELTDWTLPSSLTDRLLSGRVILSNGDIPVEAAVELARPGTEETIAAVDAKPDGTFEVRLLNGVPYELRAIALQGGVFHEGRLLVQPDWNAPVTIPLVNVGLQPSSKLARDFLQKMGLQ